MRITFPKHVFVWNKSKLCFVEFEITVIKYKNLSISYNPVLKYNFMRTLLFVNCM